ncbi:hypothetical protein ONZ51_g3410 [Trametes cubensis]|uniref:Acyl-protein thioesterase 1 n=1 Tax=Trametes cubensis TaxID=1111947 RepID=A0AAD7TYV3_9APHY|nr:hypothetical protein ONZ51_g3410 [Trametes cubensis]
MASAGGSPVREAPLVIPPQEVHHATVIFIHGLGQRGDSWIPILQGVIDRLPGVKWVLPQAPEAPVTYNGGQCRPSWFDIANLPPCNCYDEAGITASVAVIEEIITSELRGGLDSNKIIMAGFSQGGALSLMTSLTTLHELGGVASLSGWIPQQSRQAMLQLEPDLPVFWAHGKADTEIPISYGEDSISFLRDSLNIPANKIVFRTYEGLEHTVNNEELEDFAAWLSHVLA